MIKHTLKNGTEIEINTREYCGHISAETRIKGKYYSGTPTPPEKQLPAHRKVIADKGCPGYWFLDAVILPPEKGVEVAAMIAEAQAILDATPEAILRRLIGEREDICADIRASIDEAQRAQDRSYESGEGTGAWVYAGEKYKKEEKKDRGKLAEFDLAHPGVVAEINRRKEEAHKSWLASD